MQKSKSSFMPGLQLSRAFFDELIQPELLKAFPDLSFSAGLMGDGSEVLGFDTIISMDHDWGLRVHIFLNEDDFVRLSEKIILHFESMLPDEFMGYQVAFDDPDRPKLMDWENFSLGSSSHGVEIYMVIRGLDLLQSLYFDSNSSIVRVYSQIRI